MKKENCYNCQYFHKRAGVGNYFIFRCYKWGLIVQDRLPMLIIFESIGKKCPFFTEKINKKKDSNILSDDNNLDILV